MADLVEKASGPTIANYISAIRTFCKDRNIPTDAIEDSYAITKSIVALRHLYPSTRRFARNAMTVQDLLRILPKLDMKQEEDQCFWCMLTTGFYGLLRLGEMTKHIDSRRHLRLDSVKLHKEGFYLELPASKTDQNYLGAAIFIHQTGDLTCPAAAMHFWLMKSPKNRNFLFFTKNGIATRSWFLTKLRSVTERSQQLSGHSLRRGGASWAATMGYTHDQIMQMGRWSSSAFRVYLRNYPQLDFALRRETKEDINQSQ